MTGKDVLEAFDRLEVLESTAGAIMDCGVVGETAPMARSSIGHDALEVSPPGDDAGAGDLARHGEPGVPVATVKTGKIYGSASIPVLAL